jgi:hypothetical protein
MNKDVTKSEDKKRVEKADEGDLGLRASVWSNLALNP